MRDPSAPNDGTSDLIRITKEDANGAHVDDLINRMFSLRGETGMRVDRGRRWYYQSWFVLMIAGLVAAVAGWAILEPYFNDLLYVQGTIDKIEDLDGRTLGGELAAMDPTHHAVAWLYLAGEKVLIFERTRVWMPDETTEPLDITDLESGDRVGVYVDRSEDFSKPLHVAVYVVLDPPARSESSSPSLAQQNAQNLVSGLLLFPLIAGFVGLAIGTVDGIVCRLLRRALIGGAVGLFVGFIGGFISEIVASVVYAPLNALALQQTGSAAAGLSGFGLFVQMSGRSLAWCIAGMAMGLGQGIALRSPRLLLYGFLGGAVGGVLGGLLFDPIDLLLLGYDKPSALWSRLVGLAIVGASVGAMIGVVERLARDAWLRMVEGPLSGKEFLLFKDLMRVGASPRSEIYLFSDDAVAPQHATIRAVGENYELENECEACPALVNGRPITRTRLRHGDQIAIGRTVFVFQKRRG